MPRRYRWLSVDQQIRNPRSEAPFARAFSGLIWGGIRLCAERGSPDSSPESSARSEAIPQQRLRARPETEAAPARRDGIGDPSQGIPPIETRCEGS